MDAAPPGCVIEFWIGAAVGAVGVLGGAENVRIPRLPPENPPPARACASAVISRKTAAIAINAVTQWGRNMTLSPGQIAREHNSHAQGHFGWVDHGLSRQ